MCEEGEEKGRSKRGMERRRTPSPWGEGCEDDDEHGDASPLLPLMFNHEPVDADPSLRRLTFH